MTLAIGIDLGATKVAGALVNEQGHALAEARALTHAQAGVEPVVARIAEVVAQLLAQASEPVMGVGIGTPGLVDGAAGIVRNAVNLGWTEVALAHEAAGAIATQTGNALPVWVENDANSQAVGEFIFGAGRGLESFALVAIGTGLGGGIIANRQLIAGATYTAAELGHLSLDPDGRPCACGLRGCVETVVSGPGLVKSMRERLAQGGQTTLPAEFHAEDVVAAARAGDALALAALAETARWLGIALAAYVALLNPAAIVVGGGLGLSAFDLLIPAARVEIARRALPQSHETLQIVPAQVMSSAVGAAALVWQNQP
ncbi:MAG: ROK family protein [Caldilineaceae bacterium]|nr:ROK family protein [Caldilineaceae bacterium]